MKNFLLILLTVAGLHAQQGGTVQVSAYGATLVKAPTAAAARTILGVSGGGGGSGSTNWVDTGTTNATLAGTASINDLIATNGIKLPGLTLGAFVKVDSTTGYLTNVTRLSTVGTTNISLTGTLFVDSINLTNPIAFATGGGVITRIQGPSDQALSIVATAPVQASASVAGNAVTLSASAATAGSVTVGTAAGGAFNINGGAASTMTITGTAGAGGALAYTAGAGGVNSFAGTATGGAGGAVTIATGAGGNATGASGSRTGGASGTLTLATGAVGTGATANGATGDIVFSPGGTARVTMHGAFTGFGVSVPVEYVQVAGGVKVTGPTQASTASSGSMDFSSGLRFLSFGSDVSTLGAIIFRQTTSDSSSSQTPLTINASGLFQIFGTTSSFPAIKRNAAGIDIRLADDSGYALLVSGGTTAAGNAAAGTLGEVVSSLVASGSPVSLTTATGANVTSISLTAGDWDVEGNINFAATTATVTGTSGGITSTSATVPTDGSEVFSGVQVTVLSETDSVTLPRKRINVNSTTTVYLVGKCTFSAGTVAAFGSINARRVR